MREHHAGGGARRLRAPDGAPHGRRHRYDDAGDPLPGRRPTLVLALVSPGGAAPVLRARRLIAVLRLDLIRLTEERFLAERGDRTVSKQRFAECERQARRG